MLQTQFDGWPAKPYATTVASLRDGSYIQAHSQHKVAPCCWMPAWRCDEAYWGTGKDIWWRLWLVDGTPWVVAGLWREWADPETGEVVLHYTTSDPAQHCRSCKAEANCH